MPPVAAAAAAVCSICCDDEVEIKFACLTGSCDYCLCADCLVVAFEDHSGQNCRTCPFCKSPTAKDMLIAQVGQGAVSAVEQEIRPGIEHGMRQQLSKKKASQQEASELNNQAVQFYNEIVEAINLKCPRCQLAFYDYNGCNALYCSSEECGARFCAICLKDCGTDAHPHVREAHGNLFDKDKFNESKQERTKRVVATFLSQLKANETFELVRLVENHLDKGNLLDEEQPTGEAQQNAKTSAFVTAATADLERMVCADRKSVLKDGNDDSWERRGMTKAHISPRSSLPDFIDLSLHFIGRDESHGIIVEIVLSVQVAEDKWRPVKPDQLKEMMEKGTVPTAGMLLNIHRSLRCAVVALEGEQSLFQTDCAHPMGPTKMGIRLCRVNQHGNVTDEIKRLYGHRKILALNANERLASLSKHVSGIEPSSIPSAIKHFIGVGKPLPVLSTLDEMVGDSLGHLNENQQKAAHPLYLKTATEVAGPPGTGKTQVIGCLVKSILKCADKSIVVLSERNGAIDALAEKFQKLCFERKDGKQKLVDVETWMNILTFGAKEAIGVHTKEFLIEEKMKHHPDVVETKQIENKYKKALDQQTETMRSLVAKTIKSFGDHFDDDDAWNRHKAVLRDENCFKGPTVIIQALETGAESLATLQQVGITEQGVLTVVQHNSDLLEGLFAVPRVDDLPFGAAGERDWNKPNVSKRIARLASGFRKLLRMDAFDAQCALDAEGHWKEAQESTKKVEVRAKAELVDKARLKMCTIGSSHRLFDQSEKEEDTDIGLLADGITDLKLQAGGANKPGTVVIFDESGCIPSYELLGLSRLDCEIDAVLVVGDKHQLPPYDPDCNSGRRGGGRNRKNNFAFRNKPKLKSLLDVSQVQQIWLTIQYRVPRDIAEMLNARIYNGNYTTPPTGGMPNKGIHFLHVENHRKAKKYVNPTEVEHVLRLVRQSNRESRGGSANILILTPYKNQQREIQFQMKKLDNKRDGVTEDRILTIDQCQGQESDIVILTLVQKPTRFLDKNRLNVALSRTKRELYILGDRNDFSSISHSGWECAFLGQDILAAT